MCKCGHSFRMHGHRDCSIPAHHHYTQFCMYPNCNCNAYEFAETSQEISEVKIKPKFLSREE